MIEIPGGGKLPVKLTRVVMNGELMVQNKMAVVYLTRMV